MATYDENIEALYSAYRTKADALDDAFEQAKALVALDTWRKAEYAWRDQVAGTASGYTVTGRSVTKRSLEESKSARDAAVTDLEGYLGTGDAGVTFVDFGGAL